MSLKLVVQHKLESGAGRSLKRQWPVVWLRVGHCCFSLFWTRGAGDLLKTGVMVQKTATDLLCNKNRRRIRCLGFRCSCQGSQCRPVYFERKMYPCFGKLLGDSSDTVSKRGLRTAAKASMGRKWATSPGSATSERDELFADCTSIAELKPSCISKTKQIRFSST